jgi:hypothetical protein
MNRTYRYSGNPPAQIVGSKGPIACRYLHVIAGSFLNQLRLHRNRRPQCARNQAGFFCANRSVHELALSDPGHLCGHLKLHLSHRQTRFQPLQCHRGCCLDVADLKTCASQFMRQCYRKTSRVGRGHQLIGIRDLDSFPRHSQRKRHLYERSAVRGNTGRISVLVPLVACARPAAAWFHTKRIPCVSGCPQYLWEATGHALQVWQSCEDDARFI